MWRRISFAFLLTYLWIMMILVGAIVLETVMIYPNIFHDPPRSLELAEEFMTIRAPNDFFPPLGFASWVTGAGALLLHWRIPRVRYWMLASLAMIVGEGVVSMLYFWPRNTIMFVEGTEVHSAEYVIRAAQEFQSMHWTRLAFNAASAVFVFLAFLAAYRHRLGADRVGEAGTRTLPAPAQPAFRARPAVESGD